MSKPNLVDVISLALHEANTWTAREMQLQRIARTLKDELMHAIHWGDDAELADLIASALASADSIEQLVLYTRNRATDSFHQTIALAEEIQDEQCK